MKKDSNKRFEKVYVQGVLEGYEVIVDRETGVNYLHCFGNYSGGLTVLLGADGKPVISPVENR